MCFFFFNSVRVCVCIFIEPILRSFFACGRHLFHSHCSLFAVRWMLNNKKKNWSIVAFVCNNSEKCVRVSVFYCTGHTLNSLILYVRPYDCMCFHLCVRVYVCWCACVHEWVLMEKQTKFCFYSRYLFPRR